MKLRQLKINGFGHLHGMDITLQGPATILYGPNEAGKSTLLGFVRSMLFGIPTRAMSAQRYEPVRGGSHGGLLVITADDGCDWSIERYATPGGSSKNTAGMRGERLRILRTDPAGGVSEWTQEDMQRELLGGMSREMYNQLFAVSLTELQEVSALRSEEMSRFLFHAGIGGGSAVLRGEKQLLQEMDKLYRPRGRIQEIPKMIQSFEQLEEETAAMKLLLPRYNEVLAELDQVRQQLSEHEENLTEIDRELAGVKRAAKLVNDWVKREHIRLELAGLSGVEKFPEQGLQRYQAIQTEKERQLLEKRELDRKIEALQQELILLKIPTRLLEQENIIRSLAGNLPGYEAKSHEISDLEAEERSLQERLNRCLRSIHPDWTLEDLNRFSGTVGEQEAVRQVAGKFHACDKELDRVQAERLKMERLTQHAGENYSSASQCRNNHQVSGQDKFSSLVPDTSKEIQVLWNEICIELDRYRDQAALRYAKATAAEAEELYKARIKSLYKTLLRGGLILTLIIPVLIFLISGSIGSTVLTAVFLVLFDLYVLRGSMGDVRKSGRRSSKSRGSLPDTESITSPESRLNHLLPRLLRYPLATGNSIQGSGEWTVDWEEEERELRPYMESWQHWDRRLQLLLEEEEGCRRQYAQAEQQLAGLVDELQHRTSIMSEVEKEWQGWLLVRKLPADMSPEGVLDVFRLAETGRDIAERISAVSMKITKLRWDQTQYEDACSAIEWSAGDTSSSELIAIERLRYAVNCLEEGLRIQNRRELISAKLMPLVEQRDRVTDRLSLLSDSERDLLKEAHVEDGEEFLRIGAEQVRIQELTAELRRLDVFLFGGSPEDKRDEIVGLLQQYDEDQLKDIVRDKELSRNTANLKWQQLQEMRGRLLHEKENLELTCRQESLYQQVEDQRSALSEVTGEYVVRALCLELIRAVRRVYEEERQPAVLQLASGYFSEMTGGMYRRVVMKMGSQELMAEHTKYGLIESHHLSRGTAEQLYLAMRLALSNAVSSRMKQPLLLDDLFVNFDASRLKGTLSVLSEISAKHQIIMMTCHPHVLTAVRRSIPECQVVEL